MLGRRQTRRSSIEPALCLQGISKRVMILI